ncbi:MAG: hypothetical protein HY234_03345 [Acidobacteria bacterium]|nr:hypothetical protein [Acidobacteriota bacterium]
MATALSVRNEELTARLQQAKADLQELEAAILTANVDVSVLRDFRTAVNAIRQTAWVVEQWLEQQNERRDPYTLLPALYAERVRRATLLSRDLSADLDTLNITLETAGLQELWEAVEPLFLRLARILRHK